MYQINDKLKLYYQNALISLVFLLFFLCLASCSDTTSKKKSAEDISMRKSETLIKPPSSFSDTLIINFPAAVFFNPDSVQLEKIKVITDTMIFESSKHDCFYQMRYSRKAIQQNWPAIKIIEINNARYILLKSKNGDEEFIDLNSKSDFCGIFLFDGYKKAQLADMTNIDSEMGFYFSK